MTTVDFLEIPKANTGTGDQDTFELFARDFLEDLGYRIIQGPGRGSDCGRDLIVEESRTGVGGETLVRWMVSCKHFAHSGKSVGMEQETNITDRIMAGGATGFLAFYSTVPSSAIVTRLRELAPNYESSIFDSAKIETCLLRSNSGHRLFSRYFPASYGVWTEANPPKPKLYFKEELLECANCGRNLLGEGRIGLSMLVQWEDKTTGDIEAIYWCCKGACDTLLNSQHKGSNNRDLWHELREYSAPTLYILSLTNQLARMNEGRRYTPDALKELYRFWVLMFHQVSRNLTPKERDLVERKLDCGML